MFKMRHRARLLLSVCGKAQGGVPAPAGLRIGCRSSVAHPKLLLQVMEALG